MELVLSLLVAAVGAGGSYWWVQSHSHPELIHRRELDLLRALIQSQHEAVLRELEQLRSLLDRNSKR